MAGILGLEADGINVIFHFFVRWVFCIRLFWCVVGIKVCGIGYFEAAFPHARTLAILLGYVVVVVPRTTGVDELLALPSLNVVPPAGEVTLARSAVSRGFAVGVEVDLLFWGLFGKYSALFLLRMKAFKRATKNHDEHEGLHVFSRDSQSAPSGQQKAPGYTSGTYGKGAVTVL
uniref:Uncharacterized protein n=1 Tax=Amblyomma triste TaxID=251400 RepID=A0A023G581_AMBTT